MIGKTVGHYRITSKLGAGGMGEVFLAEDTRLERKAAIKFLPVEMAAVPERRQRFLIEAKAASALNHPNVCVVYDVGETADGLPFIAMEYVEGQALDELVKQGPLAIPRAVEIISQVADALDAAHSGRVVHRDIKPANIILNDRGKVKVLDFGLAKRMPADSRDLQAQTADMQQTQSGQVLGTPSYMSPEQALGQILDHRTDIFSMGVVLYELTTGQKPFTGASLGETITRIVNSQPTAIARLNYDVPPELERITLKCLQKSPDRRYQTARDLLVDLTSLQRELEAGGGNQTHDWPARSGAGSDARGLQSGTLVGAATSTPVATNPQEIARSDIVITYANLDDLPVRSGRQGWVSNLQQNLQIRVAQLSGKQVTIVKQPDVSNSAEMESAVLEHMPQAKTVVSVLSPPFAL